MFEGSKTEWAGKAGARSVFFLLGSSVGTTDEHVSGTRVLFRHLKYRSTIPSLVG